MAFYTPRNIGPADQILFDADGNAVGIQPAASSSPPVLGFNPTKHAAIDSLVSGAGNAELVADQRLATSRAQAAFYAMADGSGTALAEQGGKGPSITVTGTTAGIWANAGCLTVASDNVIKKAADPYVDALISMQTEGCILIGQDIYLNAYPVGSSESAWGLHRTEQTTGGVRMVLINGGAGRFGVYYKSNGGTEGEIMGATPLVSHTGRWISTLTELRVRPMQGELHSYLYLDGRLERSNVVALGTPPATDATGGLSFSGYGGSSLQKLNSGSTTPSGARIRNCFAMRHSGADRNIAPRLAAYIAANAALPTWLTRV